MTANVWEADALRLAVAHQPVQAPSRAQIVSITTAYEQGFGKGMQARERGAEIENPYAEAWGCRDAWQIGYDEGRSKPAGMMTVEAHQRIVAEAVAQAYERAAQRCMEQRYVGLIAATLGEREAYALALCHAEDAIRALKEAS